MLREHGEQQKRQGNHRSMGRLVCSVGRHNKKKSTKKELEVCATKQTKEKSKIKNRKKEREREKERKKEEKNNREKVTQKGKEKEEAKKKERQCPQKERHSKRSK